MSGSGSCLCGNVNLHCGALFVHGDNAEIKCVSDEDVRYEASRYQPGGRRFFSVRLDHWAAGRSWWNCWSAEGDVALPFEQP